MVRTGLGELERAVMDVLWDADDWRTVRQVHEALAERAIAYTTVMTVLDRLARKELVIRDRDGRAHRYRAAETRGEMTAEAMRGALDGIGAGDARRAALVAFVGEASADDRAALREALARLESDAGP